MKYGHISLNDLLKWPLSFFPFILCGWTIFFNLYDIIWYENNNLGYVRLNGSYNILKSINFQVAGIPSLCKEKNMNVKSMSYTGKVLWTVWELDVEDYEILFLLLSFLFK